MGAWFSLLKSRMVLLLLAAVVVAGLAPVLYFIALFGWQISGVFQAGSWIPLPAALAFTDHSLVQAGKAAPVLPFIPQLHWSWATHKVVAWMLGQLHVGLIPALVGLAVTAIGALRVLQQNDVIRVQEQWHEDRLRRVLDYRREDGRAHALDGRREPFISSHPAD